MLNIGQVVYDYTNERVLIFAGVEMKQNRKTNEHYSETGFILKDGTFIHLKEGEKIPFEYNNINMGSKVLVGAFVTKCECAGCYFGIINGHDAEVKVWAKETIEEIEGLIAKHGLNMIEKECGKKKYPYYYIGND